MDRLLAHVSSPPLLRRLDLALWRILLVEIWKLVELTPVSAIQLENGTVVERGRLANELVEDDARSATKESGWHALAAVRRSLLAQRELEEFKGRFREDRPRRGIRSPFGWRQLPGVEVAERRSVDLRGMEHLEMRNRVSTSQWAKRSRRT